jgi:Fe-S-cluster containining protein
MLETNLAKIAELAKQKEDENWQFRRRLKHSILHPKEIDAIVRRLWGVVSAKIDCRKCANCCQELVPAMGRKDIVRLARAVNVTPDRFKKEYLNKTDEKGRFVIRQKPCPFLAGKLCRHYDSRPEACAEFPFLHKPDFTTRSIMVLWNLPLCPIVYNVYELLKPEIAELEYLRRTARFSDIE